MYTVLIYYMYNKAPRNNCKSRLAVHIYWLAGQSWKPIVNQLLGRDDEDMRLVRYMPCILKAI